MLQFVCEERMYLTIREIAEQLNVSRQTVRSWCYEGKLEATQLRENGLILVKAEWLERAIDKGRLNV